MVRPWCTQSRCNELFLSPKSLRRKKQLHKNAAACSNTVSEGVKWIAVKGRSVKVVIWIRVFGNLFSVSSTHLQLSTIEAKTVVKTVSMLKLKILQHPCHKHTLADHHLPIKKWENQRNCGALGKSLYGLWVYKEGMNKNSRQKKKASSSWGAASSPGRWLLPIPRMHTWGWCFH